MLYAFCYRKFDGINLAKAIKFLKAKYVYKGIIYFFLFIWTEICIILS